MVGTISLSARGRDVFEVGNLILDERYRGQGLMRAAVEQLTLAPGTYIAEVKIGNEPSFAVFRATGFSESAVTLRKDVR